jgi:uncharacterized protein (TIGR01244 family)
VINNRPDAETPDQPGSDMMAAAAQAAGMAYVHIPMGLAGPTQDIIYATGRAITQASGPVLAFCRSGSRSSILWGLAKRAEGMSTAEIVDIAAKAGYDLRPILSS